MALKRILAGYEIFSADNENLIFVTKRRSRVRVGTEAPQRNPSCPTAPTDLPLPGALDLGLGGLFGGRKFGFCGVEARAPLTVFRNTDNENVDSSNQTPLARSGRNRFSLRFPQGQVVPRTPAGRSSTQMALVLRHFFGTDVTYCASHKYLLLRCVWPRGS